MKKVKKFREGGSVERLAPDQSFKSAFAEARKAGAGSFSWKGKKFTTEMAKPKSKPAAPAADDDSDRNVNSRSYDRSDLARETGRAPA